MSGESGLHWKVTRYLAECCTEDGRSTYVGQMENGNAHGQGKCTNSNGHVYEGGWKDGKRHGTGKYTWPDGRAYEGAFKDGVRHGHGKMTFADGDVYEGEWKDDSPHGQGKLTHSNGEVYEGEFKDGDALPKRDDDSDTILGPPAKRARHDELEQIKALEARVAKLEGELAAKRARSEGVE